LELSEVFDRFAVAVESLQQCELFLSGQREQVDLLLENLGDT
jgi:exodeoxyribonuclease VII small subunit